MADAWSVPSHYLNQCWFIVNLNLENKLNWNHKQNSYIFIIENALEYYNLEDNELIIINLCTYQARTAICVCAIIVIKVIWCIYIDVIYFVCHWNFIIIFSGTNVRAMFHKDSSIFCPCFTTICFFSFTSNTRKHCHEIKFLSQLWCCRGIKKLVMIWHKHATCYLHTILSKCEWIFGNFFVKHLGYRPPFADWLSQWGHLHGLLL